MRRATALKSALGPLLEFLTDDVVVAIMLNADGAVWIEEVGAGMRCTRVRMPAPDAASRRRRPEGTHPFRLGSSLEALPALLVVGEAIAARAYRATPSTQMASAGRSGPGSARATWRS
jgi:hypothetical protein